LALAETLNYRVPGSQSEYLTHVPKQPNVSKISNKTGKGSFQDRQTCDFLESEKADGGKQTKNMKPDTWSTFPHLSLRESQTMGRQLRMMKLVLRSKNRKCNILHSLVTGHYCYILALLNCYTQVLYIIYRYYLHV